MDQLGDWTNSQRKAWSFVQLGVGQELTATTALAQYRSGGGAIRDSSWYSLYKTAFAMYGSRESITKIPGTYTVPDSMAEEVDMDLYRKYRMNVEVVGYDLETGQRITQWIAAESDVLLTKSEWVSEALRAISGLGTSRPIEFDHVATYEFMQRSGSYA